MSKHFLLILFVGLFYCCNNSQSNKNDIPQKAISQKALPDFSYHFKILDSAANAVPQDSIVACCPGSINFMETETGIEGSDGGSLVGKLWFSKTDLKKWHEWYKGKSWKDSD